MNAFIPENVKVVDVDGRRFTIHKFNAFAGMKISKMLISKMLPVFQPVLKTIGEAIGELQSGEKIDSSMVDNANFAEAAKGLANSLDLEGISHALDLVSEDDFDYIMKTCLKHCFEHLSGGTIRVLNDNDTFAVQNLEYNTILALRLICEAILWGIGDFFDVSRLTSVLKPLFSLSRLNRQTSTDTSSNPSEPGTGNIINFGMEPTP